MASDSVRARLYEFEDQNYGAITKGKQFALAAPVPLSFVSTTISVTVGPSAAKWALPVAAIVWIVLFFLTLWEWWEFRASTDMLEGLFW